MLFITAKEINNPELLTQFNEKFYIDFPFRGVKLEQTSEVCSTNCHSFEFHLFPWHAINGVIP